MRYLAIDPGEKRTGLATGDAASGIVTPAGRIEAGSRAALIDALVAAVAEHEPDELVIGLPLNMDGSEGPAAKGVRELAAALAERVDLPMHLVDERLTSFAADKQMGELSLTRGGKKLRRDAMAAAVILRDFLERQA